MWDDYYIIVIETIDQSSFIGIYSSKLYAVGKKGTYIYVYIYTFSSFLIQYYVKKKMFYDICSNLTIFSNRKYC